MAAKGIQFPWRWTSGTISTDLDVIWRCWFRPICRLFCLSTEKIESPDLVKEIKRSSSRWLKTKGDELSDFAWQTGYGAFSVSYSNLDQVKEYIANQEEHHRTMTWDEEYQALLERHGITFDERFYLD